MLKNIHKESERGLNNQAIQLPTIIREKKLYDYTVIIRTTRKKLFTLLGLFIKFPLRINEKICVQEYVLKEITGKFKSS